VRGDFVRDPQIFGFFLFLFLRLLALFPSTHIGPIFSLGRTVSEIDFVHASRFLEGERFDGEKTPDKLTPAKTAPKLAPPEADQSKDDSSQSSMSRAESDEDIEDSSPQTPAEGDDLLGQIVEKELQLKTQEDMVAKLKEELAKYRSVEAASEEFAKVAFFFPTFCSVSFA